ncbi:MAG: PKD domain-containing protein [Opitutales bacterium]|nr:PKD domain-containing protein [Opitutales bacterium]
MGNQAPTPVFTHSSTAGLPPVTVNFDASASTDPEGDPLTYSWDFGDGQTATGVQPSHTYTAFGDFEVVLTVNDGQGNTRSTTRTLRIQNLPPVPAFTFSPESGNAPLAISFNASASSDPEGQPLSFAWEFGDGATATGPTPTHTYTTAINTQVRLTVTDPQGGSAVLVKPLSVLDAQGRRAPELPLSPEPDPALLPGVVFQVYNAADWGRTMGNINTLSPLNQGVIPNVDIRGGPGERFAYRFTGYLKVEESGAHTFRARVRDNVIFRLGGLTVLDTGRGKKFSGPVTHQATVGLAAGYHAFEIAFHASDSNASDWFPLLEMAWGGPGFDLRAFMPEDLFWAPGLPEIDFLVGRDPSQVVVPETVNFVPADPRGTQTFHQPAPGQPALLNFEAGPSSVPGGTITNYLWDFGGGAVGAGRTASRSFGAGTHVVTLTVQTDSGALFTVGRTIRVVAPPARLDYSRTHAKRVAASGQFLPTTGPDMLFRGDPNNGRWLVDAEEGFVELHFEHAGKRHAYVINEYTLTNPPAWNDRDPKDVVFSGTLDGVTWEVIDVRNNIDWGGLTRHTKSFPVNNTIAYSGYRWDIVPQAQSPQGWFVEIHEIQIFGDPAAQPEIRAPIAAFAAPATAERRQPVTFDARAAISPDGYPLVYFWDFGDGQTLHTANPVVTHRYFAEGTFTARLQVRDTLGNLAASSAHTIAVGPLTNNDPVATFEIMDLGGLFLFDASASFDPDGDPIDFRWDFGNGIASVGPLTSHKFTPGLYAVTLTVTDDRGGRTTVSKMVDARPPVEVPSINLNFTTNFIPNHLQPYEYAGARPARNWNNLTGNATAGTLTDNFGQTVPVSVQASGTRQFRNATQPVDNGLARMLGTQWFANGSSATYTIADVPYALYDVYVYFGGARGSPPRTQRITVGGISKFIRDDTGGWNGVLEESTATSAGQAVDGPAYVVFRDVSAANLVITFDQMNDPGASGIQIISAEGANLRPTAAFALTPASGQAPVTVAFDASASTDPDGFIETYEWDFLGDGSWLEGDVTAQFTYLFPGTYQAALRVTDNRGDSDVTTREIVITGEPPPNQPPVAVVGTSRLIGQAPHAVQLDASSSSDPDGEIVAFEWDFTNNGTFDATGPLATTTFPDPGEYTIRLRLTDDDGDHTEALIHVTVTEEDPDSRLVVDWGRTAHPGLIRGGANPVTSAVDLSGNGTSDDLLLEFPFSLTTPLTTPAGDYSDVPVYGGLRVGAFAQDEVDLVERAFGGSFRLLPEAGGPAAGADTRVSWGPSTEILDDRWMNIGNTATSTPAGSIAGNEGTFRYRSHTTAVVTNMTYDNPPESPHFGYAISQWQPGSAPNVFLRIEGRGTDGDHILFNNSASGSTYGATLAWWELDQPHNAAAIPLEVEALVSGAGAWAIAVRDGEQWYLGQPGQINVPSLDAIQWTPYNPVHGDPLRLFANVTGPDTAAPLALRDFESRVFGNITAIGLYSERVATAQGRSVQIRGFNVRPGVPEPLFQFHLAALWTKENFLNGGDDATAVFSDDSFLRLVGLEVPGAPADVRWVVREGANTFWVSEAVSTTATGSPELTFATHRADGRFAQWNPLTGLRFEATEATWEDKKFADITAVGILLDREMAAPAPEALVFDRFEAALRLLPAASGTGGFADWAAANNISGGPADETLGLANLQRYALGGNATTPAGALTPRIGRQITPDGLRATLTFERVADPALVYAVWASTDLIDWGAEPVWSSTGPANLAGEITIEDTLHLAPGTPRFLRLSIELP